MFMFEVIKHNIIAIRKNVLQYVSETKILQYIGKPIILHSPSYQWERWRTRLTVVTKQVMHRYALIRQSE